MPRNRVRGKLMRRGGGGGEEEGVGEEGEDRERGEKGEAEYANEVRLFIGKMSVYVLLRCSVVVIILDSEQYLQIIMTKGA